MQGKKHYQRKFFTIFQLSDRVPVNSFDRQFKEILNFHFLYKMTESCSGSYGQKSINPLIFFKLCLVDYLENIKPYIPSCNLQGWPCRFYLMINKETIGHAARERKWSLEKYKYNENLA